MEKREATKQSDLDLELRLAEKDCDALREERLAFIWPFCRVRALDADGNAYVRGAPLTVEALELSDADFAAACDRYIRQTYNTFALQAQVAKAFAGLGRKAEPLNVREKRYDAQRLFLAWTGHWSDTLERRCGRQIELATEALDRAASNAEFSRDERNLIDGARAYLRKEADTLTEDRIVKLSKLSKLRLQESKRRGFRTYELMVKVAGPYAVVLSYYMAQAYKLRHPQHEEDFTAWKEVPVANTPDDVLRILGINAQTYSEETFAMKKLLTSSVKFYDEKLARFQALLRRLYYEKMLEETALERLAQENVDAELRRNLLGPTQEERELLKMAKDARLGGRSDDADRLQRRADDLRVEREKENDRKYEANNTARLERLKQAKTTRTKSAEERESTFQSGNAPDARAMEGLDTGRTEQRVAEEEARSGAYGRGLKQMMVVPEEQRTRSGRLSKRADNFGGGAIFVEVEKGSDDEGDYDPDGGSYASDGEEGSVGEVDNDDLLEIDRKTEKRLQKKADASREERAAIVAKGKGVDLETAKDILAERDFVDDGDLKTYGVPGTLGELWRAQALNDIRRLQGGRQEQAERLVKELGVDLPTAYRILDERAEEKLLAKATSARSTAPQYFQEGVDDGEAVSADGSEGDAALMEESAQSSGDESEGDAALMEESAQSSGDEGEPALKMPRTDIDACIHCGTMTTVKPLHEEHVAATCNAECRAGWLASLVPIKKKN